ncbi:MAG: nucleoside deaminase, partial [Pseudomonadota bacterium]|nr:nucleoside deaminase [Pseudomonadota bacterium]
MNESVKLCSRFLEVIENDIIPKTRKSVNGGNKVFGGAILKKEDWSVVAVGVNAEIKNPIFHGEISTLLNFFKINETERPSVKDCFFLSTHEPCSLCLSAITWSGF